MTEHSMRVHERQAHRTGGASDEFFMIGLPCLRPASAHSRYFSSAACGVLRKLIAIRL